MGSDIRKIQKKVEKLGKKIADDGTYKTWTSGSNHPKVSWEYKGKEFLATFPSSSVSYSAIPSMKQQIKRNLKSIGFNPPKDFLRLEPTLTSDEREIQELVEEIYSLLDEDED